MPDHPPISRFLPQKPYLRGVSLERDRAGDPNRWPFTIPAFSGLSELEFHADVTFLVGENGSGKSTLLEAIADKLRLRAEGGMEISFLVDTPPSVFGDALSLLRGGSRPTESYFLRAESFYNVATELDEQDKDSREAYTYGVESLHGVSHGEAFLAALSHKLLGAGLYLMDEPEAALSPQRQLAALASMHNLVQNASQFIIATHSPILLAYPHAKILMLDERGIREVDYEETEHFQITRDFLNHRERTLRYLLGEDEG